MLANVTVTEWRARPSGGGLVGLVAGSFIEACFPATVVGFIVGIAVKLGAGIAAAANMGSAVAHPSRHSRRPARP